MPVTITEATAKDAAEILALQKLAFRSEAELYRDYSIEPLTQRIDEMTSDFDRYLFLKAVEGGRIVGSVKGRMTDAASCWIGRLMVHPDCQNLGIGKNLLREIELRFPAARRYELATGHLSEKNIRLYERSGYAVFKKEKIAENIWFVFMEKIREGGRAS